MDIALAGISEVGDILETVGAGVAVFGLFGIIGKRPAVTFLQGALIAGVGLGIVKLCEKADRNAQEHGANQALQTGSSRTTLSVAIPVRPDNVIILSVPHP